MVAAARRDTPLAEVPLPDGPLCAVTLSGRQRRNLLLMLATRPLAQAAVAGIALFAFFSIFGLLVITPAVAQQWIGALPVRSILFANVPVALLRQASLLAAFGSMHLCGHVDERRGSPAAVSSHR